MRGGALLVDRFGEEERGRARFRCQTLLGGGPPVTARRGKREEGEKRGPVQQSRGCSAFVRCTFKRLHESLLCVY